MPQFQKHVFVCTTGKECPLAESVEVFRQMKAAAKGAGVQQTVRINQSGCLGQCGHGPMVVVYPEDVWYAAVTLEKAQRIFDEHLMAGRAVDDLRYVAPPGENKLPKAPKSDGDRTA